MKSKLSSLGSAFALVSLALGCAAEPADTGVPGAGTGGSGNYPSFGGAFGASGASSGGDAGVGGNFGSGGTSGYGGTNGASGSDGFGGAVGSNGVSGSTGSSGSGGSSGSDGSGGSGGTGGTGVDAGTDGCIPFPFPCPTGGTAGVGGTAGAPGDAGDSLPGFTPMPNNPPQCPQGAPANPIGPCLGLPIYLACNYTNGMRNYGCVCDWYHWLCI